MTLEQFANAAEFLVLLIVAVTLVFLVFRIHQTRAYRSAIGLALAGAFILVWVNLAVGIIGDSDNLANLMYVGVLAIGIIGAILARFQPYGMARALFAVALAQALVTMIVLIGGLGVPGKPVSGVILILNGFFIVLWLGSAMLFRKAAREQTRRGRGAGRLNSASVG